MFQCTHTAEVCAERDGSPISTSPPAVDTHEIFWRPCLEQLQCCLCTGLVTVSTCLIQSNIRPVHYPIQCVIASVLAAAHKGPSCWASVTFHRPGPKPVYNNPC